jgi:HK97 family phage portal protein
VVAFFQLSGNTYILRNGPSDTRPPTELWPLRPDRTKVHITGDAANPIDGYNYGPDSGNYAAQFFGQDRINSKLVQKVLHIKTFHPTNDWYGLSPIQAAARNVDHSNAIQAWNVSLLQNACRPSGLLSLTNGELSDVQYEEAKDRLNVEKSGPSNAGKSLILTGDWKWQSMSLSPAELDWGEGDNATTRKICTAFGVPPELLGLMVKTGLNDSNFVQARRKFYMEKILPTLDHFRDDFNNWLSPMFGDGIWLDYDRDQIEAIQEDRQIVWDSNIAAVKASVLTPNEARKKLGYPEIDGGNELLVPTNVVPMGALLAGIASPPKPALAAVQG